MRSPVTSTSPMVARPHRQLRSSSFDVFAVGNFYSGHPSSESSQSNQGDSKTSADKRLHALAFSHLVPTSANLLAVSLGQGLGTAFVPNLSVLWLCKLSSCTSAALLRRIGSQRWFAPIAHLRLFHEKASCHSWQCRYSGLTWLVDANDATLHQRMTAFCGVRV